MKKEKYLKIEDVLDSLFSGLQLENEILHKKLNHKKLTPEEEIFDKFIFPPSSILRLLKRRMK